MEEKNFMEEINLGEIPFDVDFHPSDNLLATALINGDIHLYRFSPDSVPAIGSSWTHRSSARFIDCGRVLFTASSDCSILATDVETGFKITHIHNAHKTEANTSPAINKLINLTEFTVASGDDEGFVKDIRTRSCCNYYEAHENYISDMTFASGEMKLLTTRIHSKVKVGVEWYELSSIVLMKNGRKLVCGSSRGIIQYAWECFNYISDARFFIDTNDPIHAMLKLDEDTFISGSEKGIMNLNGIFPDFIYPIAEHSGVECLGNI
ncbi:hypothetical protein VNO80_26285 [Phaseolus coccineus]|uniref:Uncharacterized protein n=1 Tax=Phaseolus coccineus TaxID=3886 RepID=A0AAN9LI53_PHACN